MHDMKNVVAKWISKEDFPKNFLGELSNSSSRRKTHDCFGELPTIHLGGLSNRYYQKSVLCFQEQKHFVLKIVFSHIWLRHA